MFLPLEAPGSDSLLRFVTVCVAHRATARTARRRSFAVDKTKAAHSTTEKSSHMTSDATAAGPHASSLEAAGPIPTLLANLEEQAIALQAPALLSTLRRLSHVSKHHVLTANACQPSMCSDPLTQLLTARFCAVRDTPARMGADVPKLDSAKR